MKLSTRTRYAVRAILELARNYGKGPVQIKVIARREEISTKYLEQLMAILKSAGLVRSIRGSQGGYLLAKQPRQIRISHIFDCLEGPVTTVECVEDAGYCARATNCAARQVWAELQQAMKNVLECITLQDLIDREKDKEALDYQT